ncbi:hypothetical protein BX600DRAFT_4349 [Xylariales sp. PMI_506]|nr:hypothetical protein BX600DRAFT_4349 [Xylariales sp. PMI_506]
MVVACTLGEQTVGGPTSRRMKGYLPTSLVHTPKLSEQLTWSRTGPGMRPAFTNICIERSVNASHEVSIDVWVVVGSSRSTWYGSLKYITHRYANPPMPTAMHHYVLRETARLACPIKTSRSQNSRFATCGGGFFKRICALRASTHTHSHNFVGVTEM